MSLTNANEKLLDPEGGSAIPEESAEDAVLRIRAMADRNTIAMISSLSAGPQDERRSTVQVADGEITKEQYLRDYLDKLDRELVLLVTASVRNRSKLTVKDLSLNTTSWTKYQLALETMRSSSLPPTAITEEVLLASLVQSPVVPKPARVPKKRNSFAEKKAGLQKKIRKVTAITTSRPTREMSAEAIKMAQVMILFALPASPTDERELRRSTTLSDGSRVTITFTAARSSSKMPFGKDAELIAWLFDRAIQADSPYISIRTASEFLVETGRTTSGADLEILRQRLLRVGGLVISIERSGTASREARTGAVVGSYRLPNSLEDYLSREVNAGNFPATPSLFDAPSTGIKLGEELFSDIKKHHVVVPREMWLQLQNGGSPTEQNIVLFLYQRCYGARSESVVPWRVFAEQYGSPEDTNTRRIKQTVKKAVNLLKLLWPEVQAEIVEQGVLVRPPTILFLENDSSMKRIRRVE